MTKVAAKLGGSTNMGKTTLTPEQHHEACAILVDQFDGAVVRQKLDREISASHQTLGNKMYTFVTVSGSKPSDERIYKVLYFLSGFANCGLGRTSRDSFLLKRSIAV